ncbi:hypothetical protein IX38_20460 [Chryseobacterium luteum]|uniref:Uncharacterized protein n=2 Tax=Chryseobacterium luteum TaxID=421531 RepID=A0A085YZM5_9FLAO|nr:hypothetical protein IX38_20460 [Chryseobacterium luteum]
MFQGVGFPSQEMQAQKIMNVKLVQQISNLDEVQVIAYGISVKALSGFNTETGKYNWRSIYSRISSHHKID